MGALAAAGMAFGKANLRSFCRRAQHLDRTQKRLPALLVAKRMGSHVSRTSCILWVSLMAFLSPIEAISQDFWWPYLASYEDGPGSIRVNLALSSQAPLSEYRYLVVTGTTYKTKRSDGLPEAIDVERLNTLSQRVVAAIQAITSSVYVGTFTHNKEQLHYVYVADAALVQHALEKLYTEACPGCKTYLNIKQDPSWSAYREFLYPNRATLEFYQVELEKLGYVPIKKPNPSIRRSIAKDAQTVQFGD